MKNKNVAENMFNVFNISLMVILIICTVIPFWMSIVGSFNEGLDYTRGGVYFWPREFTLTNYLFVLSDKQIFQAFFVSIMRTTIGTVASILFTVTIAYGMASKNLKGKNVYAIFMIVTMYISGGIIPTYILFKNLGLIDNFLVYIIPGLFSVYNMIIIQSAFREIPEAVAESARLDGATEYRILFSLFMPMSKPVIAAVSLFIAVGHWNSYFDSMMYTTSPKLQTVQLYLQQIISKATMASGIAGRAAQAMPTERLTISSVTITLATMILTTVPILCVYPFVQKHFVKGIMIGSIKG